MLPIGDHFTMGPREAAVALELPGVRCVPCHYGTFGLLTGTPDALRELAPPGSRSSPGARRAADVLMRERWFGATGRRSQIALEGTIDLEGALVLDDVSDLAAIHAAHEQGTRSSCARRPSRRSTPLSRSGRSPAPSSRTSRSSSSTSRS